MIKTCFVVLGLFLGLTANANETFYHQLNVTPGFDFDPMSLINWKVGDSSDYSVKAIFGNIGTVYREVTKEEGNAVWLTQTLDAMGKKDVTEILIDRDSGKTLKILHNGEEQTVSDEKPEIISQDYTDVTVPAGTFKAMHIVAKTKQVSRIELWINMRDVVIDGSIKQVVAAQFGNITLELTQQHKTP